MVGFFLLYAIFLHKKSACAGFWQIGDGPLPWKNMEMMEHLETKRGTSPKTEVDPPLVNNPKKPARTLIGAIEQIVNLAVELKLDTPFHEKAHSALAYVAERMTLDEEQDSNKKVLYIIGQRSERWLLQVLNLKKKSNRGRIE